MIHNHFYSKKGPFSLNELVKNLNLDKEITGKTDIKVYGIESLDKATSKDITFFSSIKYKQFAQNTKALACLTSSNLFKFLPDDCIKINVKNILFSVTSISRIFFPNDDVDYPEENIIKNEDLKKKYPTIKFGNNVSIGQDVLIGKNSYIGSNSIVESNVVIGDNCIIGSCVVIKKSLISNNVIIQDGCKIGVKGFGFIPLTNKNLRTPHVGKVILNDGVEIGANSTVDRGSMSDTVIGTNTFIDNQVHIAHNVKIGKNCMIAGQVGFAGSSTIGNNVVIGGQAGISGHLKIGNNVKIGGGSGVINNILDNSQVMGYPAIPLRDFIKKRKDNDK